MKRVYFASKLHHAVLWLTITDPRIQAHARWLRHIALGAPDSPEHASEFWIEDQEDVRNSDAVVIYAEPSDKLRGALVEAGIALECGVPVIVIGEHDDFGTWQYHPGVHRVPDLPQAFDLIASLPRRG